MARFILSANCANVNEAILKLLLSMHATSFIKIVFVLYLARVINADTLTSIPNIDKLITNTKLYCFDQLALSKQLKTLFIIFYYIQIFV
jgi:hypothetical protein